MGMNRCIKKEDYYILRDVDLEFTAVLSNVQSFSDEDHGPHLRTLLLDITDPDGIKVAEKQWVSRISLAKIARKNYGKKIKFIAHCLEYVWKDNRGPKLECYIDNIRKVELLKED